MLESDVRLEEAGPARAKRRSKKRQSFTLSGVEVRPGQLRRFEVPAATIATGAQISMPVAVMHGRTDGPHIFLTSTIHGDELNGIEIIRNVLNSVSPRTLKGTIVAAPLVNLFGFINQTRYTPDRRDLNRSFPGSLRGSLAARFAHILTEHFLSTCEYGIDLHTATNNRFNLPQIRAGLSDKETLQLANAFGAPVIMDAAQREGSLRATLVQRGVRVLLFEGGQANRFDTDVIEAGTAGTLRVLEHLDMGVEAPVADETPPMVSYSSRWVRARRGGIFRPSVELGEPVEKGTVVGNISDVFGIRPTMLRSPITGVVVSVDTNPLVNPGDGLVHVADTESPPKAKK